MLTWLATMKVCFKQKPDLVNSPEGSLKFPTVVTVIFREYFLHPAPKKKNLL
jgi:hypothetical protein